MDNRPIGIFDSGLGGLTVVKTVIRELPHEKIVYFGDTARTPYGDRDKNTLLSFVSQDIEFLLSKNVKAVVIACNTADAAARIEMEQKYDIPIVGVVRPAALKATQTTENKKIGVISTNATANSGAYEKAIGEVDGDIRVFTLGCPKLVPLVERGRFRLEDTQTEDVLREYLLPLREKGIDTLILGCTHYVLLEPLIQQVLPQVTLISSGHASAEALKATLDKYNLRNDSSDRGNMHFYVSGSPEPFAKHGSMFLGEDIQKNAHKVDF